MKKTLTIFISILGLCQVHGQEFKEFENGLIYNEKTMAKLRHIVDSLNLKYKTCDLNKAFYAKSQTVAHSLILNSGDISAARKDMERNLPFEEFVSKYPESVIKRNILILKWPPDEDNDHMTEYAEFSASGYGLEIEVPASDYSKSVKNTWAYESTGERIVGFYFPEELTSQKLPQQYAIKIGYSDCLIDTTAKKMKDDLKSDWVKLPENWQSLSLKKQQKLLDQMRSTEVVGFCSMDSRPRTHAFYIALLSAETTNWEIFLRSHLDIMNDRFSRMSDGSYAQAARQTYIHELEKLDINVPDLLIGIALRTENPATNHYYGSISRLGRAIADSKDKSEFEETILKMIADKELDNYNRVLFYFLFMNYTGYLQDKSQETACLEKVKLATAQFPDYLKQLVKSDD